MSEATVPGMSWAERAADRSPVVQRSRRRAAQQVQAIVQAARRLIALKGPSFTTQLVMAVYHHYDCAGLDEPRELIAERLCGLCLAALGGQELGDGRSARVGPRKAR